jgi:DNA-binding CsgD family transcriptional regulator/ligand-binding sensor domain-containing protein
MFFIGTLDGSVNTKRLLVPFVKNFHKFDYHGANQNWDVTQAKSGIMYFANSDGLIEYDGASWKIFPLPSKQIVRSVAVDSLGRVYVGAHEEFGYWERNSKGQFKYFSLVNLVSEESIRNQDIWKICVLNNRVYFQSFAGIFSYDGKRIQMIDTPANIFTLFKIKNRLLVSIQQMGLYELKADTLVLLEGSDQLTPQNINVVMPYSADELLVGTELGGLYLYSKGQLRAWKNDAAFLFKKSQLNKATSIEIGSEFYFIFGTITQGLVILDRKGKIYCHLTKESGLQNNTILGLRVDKHKNLWLSLDNGIDFINMNSTFRYYRDRSGELGTVYSAAVFQDRLYLGTNHGLFCADWDMNHFRLLGDFSLVENTQGQVWDLKLIDDVLFCGHNSGTFIISRQGIKKISDVSGGWVLKQIPDQPDILIQGTYIGLVVYKREHGNWFMSNMIEGYHEPTEFLEFDFKGNLWASHAYRGLYKLQLNSDYSTVLNTDYYGSKEGLTEDLNVNVFKVDQQVVFSTGKQLFSYDYNKEKLAPYQRLNDELKSFKTAHKILSIDRYNYWFFNKGKCAKVEMEQGKVKSIDALSFQLLRGNTLDGYENIVDLGNDQFLICLDDGFSIFTDQKNETTTSLDGHCVILQKISCNSQTSRQQVDLDLENPLKVNNSNNNLNFEFALPVYRYGAMKYQWKLDGYDAFWSDPVGQNQVRYSKLSHGDYTFKVRATDNYENLSSITEYQFTILPPWYLSGPAKIAYLVLLFVLVGLLRVVYYSKLDKQKKRYYLKLQTENEEQIIKLKNDHLRIEIESKSKEIANYTMMVTKKNELLNQLKEQLEKLEKYVVAAAAKKRLLDINKLIQVGINSQDHWQVFNENFDKANETFLTNLRKSFPELTPNDLRFCAFLKMNMTSKEIASLLNISPRSVEVKRYRLRKKLNMEHEENLVVFLMAMNAE